MKETIAAIATPSGQGGIGIVRVSGPRAAEIAEKVFGTCPPPRQACYGHFTDRKKKPIDQGILLYFKAPHSFTGEDVVEFQAHGGPVLLDRLLQRILSCGIRAARPGEFSEQAFLNDKIDLVQAEAIADLIAADSEAAAQAALNSLQGEFSRHVHELVEKLTRLRMYIESALDFPEEEIDFLGDQAIGDQMQAILNGFTALQQKAGQGRLLKEGMTVVIAGAPNAGKSSLLNRLAGDDSAIVTDIPGTTRDILREHIQIDGLPLHVIDTAGLRMTTDVVESEGIKRAMREIGKADRVIRLIDIRSPEDAQIDEMLDNINPLPEVITVYNKIDLVDRAAGIESDDDASAVKIHLSARTGDGVDLLKGHLKACMGFEQRTEGQFIARRRHLDALQRAHRHVLKSRTILQQTAAGELVAEELKQAQNVLCEITGEFSSDDLLGRIFADFCIGK